MQSASSLIRKLMIATSVAVVSLVFVPAAEAAGHGRHPHRGRAACDVHHAGKALRHHSRSYGGPLATRPCGPASLLSDLASRLRRATHANLGDDDAAIQNDAPAARIDGDERGTPGLRAVGLVSGALDQRPSSRAFSRRSPRGPPAPA